MNALILLIIYLVAGLIFGVIGQALTPKNPRIGFWLGFLFSVFGLLLAAIYNVADTADTNQGLNAKSTTCIDPTIAILHDVESKIDAVNTNTYELSVLLKKNTEAINAMTSILERLDRHVCDGFNQLGEVMLEKHD